MSFKSASQSGQVMLIIVLSILVILTVAMAVYVSSLSDTRLTKTSELSEQAFNAAEGGIESLLNKDDDTLRGYASDNNSIPSINFQELGSSPQITVNENNDISGMRVPQNDVLTVHLEGDVNNGYASKLDIDWVSDSGNAAGLLIDRWKNDGSDNILIDRFEIAAQQNGSINFGNNNNTAINGNNDSVIDYNDSSNSSDSYDIILRIQPIYNSATISVIGNNGELPGQTVMIDSEASAASDETRSIQVTRTYSDLPAIFDYAVYSETELIK